MRQRTRRPHLLLAVLAAVLLGGAACATGGRPAPVEDGELAAESADPTIRVIVNNESEWTLRVYALVGGSQHYLGSLQGFSQGAFEMPDGIGGSTADFRLAAKATGPTRNYYSNTVIVEEGDTVRWTVMRSFVQTRATIRVS